MITYLHYLKASNHLSEPASSLLSKSPGEQNVHNKQKMQQYENYWRCNISGIFLTHSAESFLTRLYCKKKKKAQNTSGSTHISKQFVQSLATSIFPSESHSLLHKHTLDFV